MATPPARRRRPGSGRESSAPKSWCAAPPPSPLPHSPSIVAYIPDGLCLPHDSDQTDFCANMTSILDCARNAHSCYWDVNAEDEQSSLICGLHSIDNPSCLKWQDENDPSFYLRCINSSVIAIEVIAECWDRTIMDCDEPLENSNYLCSMINPLDMIRTPLQVEKEKLPEEQENYLRISGLTYYMFGRNNSINISLSRIVNASLNGYAIYIDQYSEWYAYFNMPENGLEFQIDFKSQQF